MLALKEKSAYIQVVCADVGFNVGLQIPLAYIGVLLLKWPLHWVMALVSVADFIKVFFCYRRYYSKKWMNIFTGRDEIC